MKDRQMMVKRIIAAWDDRADQDPTEMPASVLAELALDAITEGTELELWELGDVIPAGVDVVENGAGATWKRAPDSEGGPEWVMVGPLSEGALLGQFGPVREAADNPWDRPAAADPCPYCGPEEDALLPALREARDTLWEIVEKARLARKFERKALAAARVCRDAISPYDDAPVDDARAAAPDSRVA